MRLCHGLLCDEAADVWMRGKPWCTACAIKRFGIVAPSISGAAPGGGGEPGTSRPPAAAVPTPQPFEPVDLGRLVDQARMENWTITQLEAELIYHGEKLA